MLCHTKTGITVMTGNKQGCWCRRGWRAGRRRRWRDLISFSAHCQELALRRLSLAGHSASMSADALLCVLYLCIHLLILLLSPLNLLPVPQLAFKADNGLLIAAIHLHTSRCNCFSLWFLALIVHPHGKPPRKPNKETMGPVITADEWVYTR